MSITQQVFDQGKKVKINVFGRFDYGLSHMFREAYLNLEKVDGVNFHINLSAASYIDSSALGMLLLLREYAKNLGGKVIIERPCEQISSFLKVAKFDQLFAIH